METSRNLVIRSKSVIRSSSVIGSQIGIMSDQWGGGGGTVDGHVPECHVTFGRGGLHNVRWDAPVKCSIPWRSFTFGRGGVCFSLFWKNGEKIVPPTFRHRATPLLHVTKSLSNFPCKFWMMRGGTLLIWVTGSKVKVDFGTMYKSLLALYRL